MPGVLPAAWFHAKAPWFSRASWLDSVEHTERPSPQRSALPARLKSGHTRGHRARCIQTLRRGAASDRLTRRAHGRRVHCRRPAAGERSLELVTSTHLFPPEVQGPPFVAANLVFFNFRGFWTPLCPGTVGGASSRWRRRSLTRPIPVRCAIRSLPDLAGVQGQLSLSGAARPPTQGVQRNVCALPEVKISGRMARKSFRGREKKKSSLS